MSRAFKIILATSIIVLVLLIYTSLNRQKDEAFSESDDLKDMVALGWCAEKYIDPVLERLGDIPTVSYTNVLVYTIMVPKDRISEARKLIESDPNRESYELHLNVPAVQDSDGRDPYDIIGFGWCMDHDAAWVDKRLSPSDIPIVAGSATGATTYMVPKDRFIEAKRLIDSDPNRQSYKFTFYEHE
jgi:hypothetical protein